MGKGRKSLVCGADQSQSSRIDEDGKEFAILTRAAARSLFPRDTNVYRGVDDAWTRVGIPSADISV